MSKYAKVVYNGFWFSPEREAMQALIDKTQEHCTGVYVIICGSVWACGWESAQWLTHPEYHISLLSCAVVILYIILLYCTVSTHTGYVRLDLLKGNIMVASRKSLSSCSRVIVCHHIANNT